MNKVLNKYSMPVTFRPNVYDLVIFDIDGVLLDSLKIWREIDDEYLLKYANITLDEKQREKFHKDICGLQFMETIRYIKDNYMPERDLKVIYKEFISMAKNKYEKVAINDDMAKLASILYNDGIKVVMCTANSYDILDDIIDNVEKEYEFKFDSRVYSNYSGINKIEQYNSIISAYNKSLYYIIDDSKNVMDWIDNGLIRGNTVGCMVQTAQNRVEDYGGNRIYRSGFRVHV